MKRLGEPVWQQRVREQQASGMSCPVWCNSKGVAYSTFMKWRNKLLQEPACQATSAAFIEVPVTDNLVNNGGWDIELQLGQGTFLRLRRG